MLVSHKINLQNIAENIKVFHLWKSAITTITITLIVQPQ